MIQPEPRNNEHGWLHTARRRLPLMGGIAAAAVIAVIVVVVAFGSSSENGNLEEQAVATPTAAVGESGGLAADVPPPIEGAPLDLERETVDENLNMNSVGADDRFIVPKIGVDAPLTYRSVGLDGVMPNPEGPDDVAYYDFSAWPGKGGAPGAGGNAVFAGHVDSGTEPCKNGTVPPPCEAVLWDLSNLKVGDEIQVRVGGQTYSYNLVSNQPVDAESGPWDQIVTATAKESITIITCAGNFNRETRTYSDRQVVVAERT